jgi:secondary thiamine-phosphate synthase enzyme
MNSIQVRTTSSQELLDITDQVSNFVTASGVQGGAVLVFVPHTTAGITLNENYDPNVERDILRDLERLAPERQAYYRHSEGNSASHLKASLMGSSVIVPVEDGELALGTWQGVFLCEFDGPRSRRVQMRLMKG